MRGSQTNTDKPKSPLTIKAIEAAKPREGKSYRLYDGKGNGLYIEISPVGKKSTGRKLWRCKYRFQNKEKLLALGSYPEITLEEARNLCFEARRKLAKGIDPSEERKAAKRAESGAETFEAIAREWEARFGVDRTEGYRQRVLARLEADVFPFIGKKPITEIKAPQLLEVLRRIEGRGVLETARRIRHYCGAIFRYAIATCRAETDPTYALRGALPTPKVKHMAAIKDPKAFGGLLRSIDSYEGAEVTKAALLLASLTFVRPGELRKAEWKEFDLDNSEWRIPAERMKVRNQHIVPLSRQAVEILRKLEPLTNRSLEGRPDAPRYVFPGGHSRARCMSENAVLSALRRMGYEKEEVTGHGFRGTASTLLRELNWNSEHIELQLAHKEPNKTKLAYNSAKNLPERAKMMQFWADYLDGLRVGRFRPLIPAAAVLAAPDTSFEVREEAPAYFAEVQ